jgi:sulfatase maturation enzyme AslB (radical SAM superfamily)
MTNRIFYGAGKYAEVNLTQWINKSLRPVCFADNDTQKQHTKIKPFFPKKTSFTIYSLKEALELYPSANVYITLDETTPVYKTLFNFIKDSGVSEDKIGPVPENYTDTEFILYGAGRRAEIKLFDWLCKGLVPKCFADSDEKKHHTNINADIKPNNEEFDVLPLSEALLKYPDAFIQITESPENYENAYNMLLEKGVPKDKIGAPASHCLKIGHHLLLGGLFVSCCCHSGFAEFIPTKDYIREDLETYYNFCNTLRDDLNQGKITSCSGCPSLLPGKSTEELNIDDICLATGLPGGDTCNFKCCYCNYGQFNSNKFRNRKDNVEDIIKYLSENEKHVKTIDYEAGEFTISPHRDNIIKYIEKTDWKGRFLTNAFIYYKPLSDLLVKNEMFLNVSLDSGTKETFKRVKGADCFEKVAANLYSYAEDGVKIELKYIFISGKNCDFDDIDGFFDVAHRINAKVCISRDNTGLFKAMHDDELSAIKRLVMKCIDNNIEYSFYYTTHEFIKIMKNEGLWKKK